MGGLVDGLVQPTKAGYLVLLLIGWFVQLQCCTIMSWPSKSFAKRSTDAIQSNKQRLKQSLFLK